MRRGSTSDGEALQELADGQHSTEDAGSHVVRLFAERQRERRALYAFVFVDAVAAFYSVVRDPLCGPERCGAHRTLPGVWP